MEEGAAASEAAAAPPPPAAPAYRVTVEQGDTARLASGFYDPDGNDTVTIQVELDGKESGQVVVDAEAGVFEWTQETSRLSPGAHEVVVTATDELGASSSLFVELKINSSFADRTWRYQHFGTAASEGEAADASDPDGDGLSNYGEFAFGGDPRRGEASRAARVDGGAEGSGGLRAVYARRTDHAASGLRYVAEFSADLSQWQPSAAAPTVHSDDGAMQEVSIPFPPLPPGQSGQFFRVRVEPMER